MKEKQTKIISVFLSLLLIFQQVGFAQSAAELNISGHLALMRNPLIQKTFRPAHLRFMEHDLSSNDFQLLLDRGSLDNLAGTSAEETTKQLLGYFLIGISLPNSSFWVNLRPDTPDNMIDPLLENTDVGKIFLEADIQLKRDAAKATSPETPEGKEYWDKLYLKAEELFASQNVTIPTLTRPWIVPDEIIVRETGQNAYIYKATLKVMLEEDYLAQGKDTGSVDYSFSDKRLKELNEYSTRLLKEKIIPKLTREINTSKRYAQLRQVYYSLILAQWFKKKFTGRNSFYASMIDRRNLTGLASEKRWSREEYFRQYQNSFKEGEYNYKVSVQSPYARRVRSYFSGGIAVGEISAVAQVVAPGRGGDVALPQDLINKGLRLSAFAEGGSALNPMPKVRVAGFGSFIKPAVLQASLDEVVSVLSARGIEPQRARKAIELFIEDKVNSISREKIVFRPDLAQGQSRIRNILLFDGGEGGLSVLDTQDLMDIVNGYIVAIDSTVHFSVSSDKIQPGKEEEVSKVAEDLVSFIKGLTRNKFLDMVRRISGILSLGWDDLDRNIYIEDYISGSHKHVFKLRITTKTGRKISFAVATKIARTSESITLTEMKGLEALQGLPNQLVPVFVFGGFLNGRRWYVEEFVEGELASDLLRNGRLTTDMRQEIIATLLAIAVGLNGLAPRDFHGENFVVQDQKKRAVMVDIGTNRLDILNNPRNQTQRDTQLLHRKMFLAALLAQYGFLSGSPQENHFILDAIAKDVNLTGGEGLKWLSQVYEDVRIKGVRHLADLFADLKWRNLFRSVLSQKSGLDFSSLFSETLRTYLEKSGLETGPPGSMLKYAENSRPAKFSSLQEALPRLGEQVGREYKKSFPQSYRYDTDRMIGLLRVMEEVKAGIRLAIKEALGIESLFSDIDLADMVGNAIDAVMERLDQEYVALDEAEQYFFNSKGTVTFRIFKNKTTNEVSFVLSNDGPGIQESIIFGWVKGVFESSKNEINNPDDAPRYFGKRGQGVFKLLNDALRRGYSVTFITQSAAGTHGRVFQQNLKGEKEIAEDFSRGSAGTDLVLTFPGESIEGGSGLKDPGGIDFRSLPITIEPVQNTGIRKIPTILLPPQTKLNLEMQWEEIALMFDAGIIPSTERIRGYLISCANAGFLEESGKVISFIADILREEELRGYNTEKSLKEILMLLESEDNAQRMKAALINMGVSATEPKRGAFL